MMTAFVIINFNCQSTANIQWYPRSLHRQFSVQ